MATNRLEPARLRASRVDRHIAEIEAATSDFADTEAGKFELTQTQDTVHFGPVEELSDFPPAATIALGEAVYNLRAALDYLVYHLARNNHGHHIEGTQFPIDDKPSTFWRRWPGGNVVLDGDKARGKFLNGLSKDQVLAIESLQPYPRPKWTGLLRDISNSDKHRGPVALTVDGSATASPLADRPAIDEYGITASVDLLIESRHGTFEVVSALRMLQEEVIATLDSFSQRFLS